MTDFGDFHEEWWIASNASKARVGMKESKTKPLPMIDDVEMKFLDVLHGAPCKLDCLNAMSRVCALSLEEKGLAERYSEKGRLGISDLGECYFIALRLTPKYVEEEVEALAELCEYDEEAATSRERKLHSQVLLACALHSRRSKLAEIALRTTLLRFRRYE